MGGSALVLYGADDLENRAQAHSLLAMAAEEHWGLSPLPELVRSPMGKPAFFPPQGREFNLSHSGKLALCVLDEAPVGVDIQVVKAWRPTLPGRVCSAGELEWLERQEELWPSFTALWAMKESRAKQDGRGLRGSIPSISVPLPQRDKALYFHQGLWFRLYFGSGWAACVCAQTPPPHRILWRRVSRPGLAAPGSPAPFRKDEAVLDL